MLRSGPTLLRSAVVVESTMSAAEADDARECDSVGMTDHLAVGSWRTQTAEGRSSWVLIEIIYAGGRIPDHVREMLAAAIRVPRRRGGWPVEVTVLPGSGSVISASLLASKPSAALGAAEEALDQALMSTGLFEQFDVTGKVIRVAPLEHAGRIRSEPAIAPVTPHL